MNILSKLPHDKALHAIGGVLIFSVAIALSLSVMISLVIVAGIAILKELIHDKWMGKGNPEVLDAVATVALAGIVALAYYIRSIYG